MNPDRLPLIADYSAERVFAWRGGNPIMAGRALVDIQSLAERLAPSQAYINCCDDRYHFTLVFAAGCLAGGINLLPQSRADAALAQVRQAYAGAVAIDDARVAAWLSEMRSSADPALVPTIPARQRAAVVFTSGSTGEPSPHEKCWGDLATGTRLLRQRFLADLESVHIVASVPPQHMYGLEASILPALNAGFAADTGRPSMPWDIAAALARVPEPRVLVTTPIHLKACMEAGTAMPSIDRVISATAPLFADRAQATEAAWQTRVYEIYGSSETGSIASRRPAETDVWTLYEGMSLNAQDGSWVRGGHLPVPLAQQDELQLLDAYRFRLLGRAADTLKVAGKRISLSELTRQLLAIEGVEDAAVFLPSEAPPRERPVALVVSAGCAERQIAACLARRVDPVFVPRPLLRVPSLPRNALGKLPQQALAEAWAQANRDRQRGRA